MDVNLETEIKTKVGIERRRNYLVLMPIVTAEITTNIGFSWEIKEEGNRAYTDDEECVESFRKELIRIYQTVEQKAKEQTERVKEILKAVDDIAFLSGY